MGPSARVQIMLGALATATVAFLSYFIVKRRAIPGKSSSAHQEDTNRQHVGGDEPANEKLLSEVTVSHSSQEPQKLQNEETYTEQEHHITEVNGDYEKSKDSLGDGQDQRSFIVIDNGEEAIPPDNGCQNPKKSDRSSDESSYDVIDDDLLVEEGVDGSEKDEGGHALDDGSLQKPPEQDTFLDSNETSMVIIEDIDHSGLSKSESSFYASADEQLGLESKLEEIENGEEINKKVKSVYAPQDDLSVTETDVISSVPSGVDVSSPHEEDEVEDSQTSQVHVSLDETEVSASGDDPVSPAEHLHAESLEVQDKEQISSKSEPDITSTGDVELGIGDVTEVLTLCQNSPSTVSKECIHTLVDLLGRKIPELHSTVLNCVLRVAAFTQNVKKLQESGCLKVVSDQVQEACKTVAEGDREAEIVLNSLCQVLTNLTLDPKYQTELEDTIPSLVDLLLNADKESIQLSVLRPLINFSSQPSFHHYYTRAVQDLYTILDTGSHIAKVQSLKVLVNLSLSESMVTHMLAAKAPASLLELLDVPTSTDLTLRTLTMLANIKMAIQNGNVSLASLPVEDKAASPETMYMVLHSVNSLPILRSKVFRLTRHNDEDVSHQASKLHQYIQHTSA